MSLEELQSRLGVTIQRPLLEEALTHPSYSYERGGVNYQRLEFLGDAVLGLLVADHVFGEYSDLSEGELTKLKNALVSTKHLAKAAEELGLGEFLRLGKGEEMTSGRAKQNLLADSLEALIGASFLSGGLSAAKKVVAGTVLSLLANPVLVRLHSDPKTSLIEYLASHKLDSPVYDVSATGPDHAREYQAVVKSGGKELGSGVGTTKRDSELAAAAEAIRRLNA